MIENETQNMSKPQFSNQTTTNLSSPFGSKEAHGVSIKVTLKTIEMEYGIDFMSKYTTLHINAALDYKR